MSWTTDDWATPEEIADLLRIFGPVGLDPCSNPWSGVEARTRILLKKHVREDARQRVKYALAGRVVEGDGLTALWDAQGLVFVNPPYSRPGPWAAKAAQSGDEVILLLPAATSEQWWHRWCVPADATLFWRGRVKFRQGRRSKCGARGPSALVYWGTRVAFFKEVFGPYGWFVQHDHEEPSAPGL